MGKERMRGRPLQCVCSYWPGVANGWPIPFSGTVVEVNGAVLEGKGETRPRPPLRPRVGQVETVRCQIRARLLAL